MISSRTTRHIDQDSTEIEERSSTVDVSRCSRVVTSATEAAARSQLIADAVNEFLLQARLDKSLSIEAFCNRFEGMSSALRSSIYRQIEIERYVDSSEWDRAAAYDIWPMPGETLGRFNVEREIGRGAFARVYLCRQPNVGDRHVVVKAGRLLQAEAHTLGQLRHRNIMPIFSVEEDHDRGLRLLCMPYLGTSTLHDVIDSAFVSPTQLTDSVVLQSAAPKGLHIPASDGLQDSVGELPSGSYFDAIAYIGLRLASALAHAHDLEIVHGDIKPSNVILSPRGEPFLVDFNLSGNARLALTARGGTLPYMPPEQLAAIYQKGDQVQPYTDKSDQFSLGVVLYELISGRLPFPIDGGSEPTETAARLGARQREGPAPLRSVQPAVPRKLAEIIESVLQYSPERRLPSCHELERRLAVYLSPSQRWLRYARDHRRSLAFAFSLSVLLVAAVGSIWWTLPRWDMRQVSHGTRHYEAGNYNAAVRSFDAAYRANSTNQDARFGLAKAQLKQQLYDEAKGHFFELYEASGNPRFAAFLAYAHSLDGQATQAIPWYQRALEGVPKSPELHNNLAVSFDLGGRWLSAGDRAGKASEHLQLALKHAPDDDTIRWNWLLHAVREADQGRITIQESDIQSALALARTRPNQADLQGCVARLIGLAAPSDAALIAQGLACLQRALNAGWPWDLDDMRVDSAWDVYRDAPEFEAMVQRPRSVDGKATPAIPRYLEPR